jgi:hypothetical protein
LSHKGYSAHWLTSHGRRVANIKNNGEPGAHEVTDEINGKCTTTGDEFWDAMERKPDYSAFLGRFDGHKNYRRISPDIWARWDQANSKSQTEEAFWAQMEREPDLQALIGRYGGYPRISAETWARWDTVPPGMWLEFCAA